MTIIQANDWTNIKGIVTLLAGRELTEGESYGTGTVQGPGDGGDPRPQIRGGGSRDWAEGDARRRVGVRGALPMEIRADLLRRLRATGQEEGAHRGLCRGLGAAPGFRPERRGSRLAKVALLREQP